MPISAEGEAPLRHLERGLLEARGEIALLRGEVREVRALSEILGWRVHMLPSAGRKERWARERSLIRAALGGVAGPQGISLALGRLRLWGEGAQQEMLRELLEAVLSLATGEGRAEVIDFLAHFRKQAEEVAGVLEALYYGEEEASGSERARAWKVMGLLLPHLPAERSERLQERFVREVRGRERPVAGWEVGHLMACGGFRAHPGLAVLALELAERGDIGPGRVIEVSPREVLESRLEALLRGAGEAHLPGALEALTRRPELSLSPGVLHFLCTHPDPEVRVFGVRLLARGSGFLQEAEER